MATLTGAIGTGSKWLLDKIVGAIAATGINPNVLTFLGLVVNFGAAASFAVGKFFSGAAAEPGHGVWRILRFDAGPVRGHGVVYGFAGVLLSERQDAIRGAGSGG